MKSAKRTKKDSVQHGGMSAEFICTQLDYCDATDLWTDILAVVAPAAAGFRGNILSAGVALGEVAKEFSGGKLTQYLTRLLAGTTMTVKGDGKVDLIDSRAKLDEAFTGREAFVPFAVKQALEVNFKGFLDGLDLAGIKIQTLFRSADSTPSTSDTGPSTD